MRFSRVWIHPIQLLLRDFSKLFLLSNLFPSCHILKNWVKKGQEYYPYSNTNSQSNESEGSDPGSESKKKKIFVYVVGLFSNGEICISENDLFACAEQKLLLEALEKGVTVVEAYVYRVGYLLKENSRVGIHSRTKTRVQDNNFLTLRKIDPCCFCQSLLSKIIHSQRRSSSLIPRRSTTVIEWSFWGSGKWDCEDEIPLPTVEAWNGRCSEKFEAKKKLVKFLISTT